jgi:hypothetical protein
MRDFGTRAWGGEDELASLSTAHGHAYLAYAALALGMARLVDPAFPENLVAQHDALIAAYERRLAAAPFGLIETYPGEAYPTDVAAVAAAIAVHGRVTGKDHRAVLTAWADKVRAAQLDRASGLVIQRVGVADGRPHDAPRGSGTALAAYFAGFADARLARELGEAALRHASTLAGFGAIREYADGHAGAGDVDSGPVVLGIEHHGEDVFVGRHVRLRWLAPRSSACFAHDLSAPIVARRAGAHARALAVVAAERDMR